MSVWGANWSASIWDGEAPFASAEASVAWKFRSERLKPGSVGVREVVREQLLALGGAGERLLECDLGDVEQTHVFVLPLAKSARPWVRRLLPETSS